MTGTRSKCAIISELQAETRPPVTLIINLERIVQRPMTVSQLTTSRLFLTTPEEWRDIPGYEGYYKVSNLGQVMSRWRGVGRWSLLKIKTKPNGYKFVCFSQKYKAKYYHVHRLVMLAFVGESGLHVNHKDGNKENNRLENLEYVTRTENQQHAARLGLLATKERHGRHTTRTNYKKDFLSLQAINAICRDYKLGISLTSLAKTYQRSVPHLSRIVSGWRPKYLYKEGAC